MKRASVGCRMRQHRRREFTWESSREQLGLVTKGVVGTRRLPSLRTPTAGSPYDFRELTPGRKPDYSCVLRAQMRSGRHCDFGVFMCGEL
mmetsp:Transcript_75413/g.201559  ORF Transcript_75413/g.201559 Transcript_75413/m.201559 type:complete len:90 (-) Transcript_75413:67-336(-)